MTSIHIHFYLTVRIKRVAMTKIRLVNHLNIIFLPQAKVIRNLEDIIITCNKQRPQNTDRPDHSHHDVNCLQLAGRSTHRFYFVHSTSDMLDLIYGIDWGDPFAYGVLLNIMLTFYVRSQYGFVPLKCYFC